MLQSRRSVLPLVVVSALLLAGCLGEGHGVRMTEDGRFRPNTADAVREDTEAHIANDLRQQLGRAWQVHATITPDPQWEVAEADEFGWKQATVTVVCSGPGQPPKGLDQVSITKAVHDFLRGRMARPRDENLMVQVTILDAPPAPVAASEESPVIPATVVAHPAAAATRSYAIQAGDTLADISTAFYGTPSHWRLIAAANPAVDPANLMPGTVLVIPAKP